MVGGAKAHLKNFGGLVEKKIIVH